VGNNGVAKHTSLHVGTMKAWEEARMLQPKKEGIPLV
jgi:hypothetical protein